MICRKIISPNIFHKIRQLESLSKTNLFANSCKPPQFGRTTSSLANIKQSLNSGIISNGSNHLSKFPTNATLGTQISRQASSTSGEHVRLWVIERIISSALPILIPTALILENSIVDQIMSVLVVMHTYWGLEAIITDYARPSVVGRIVPKALQLLLFALLTCTLTGLFILANKGPGVSKVIKDAWSIGKKPTPSDPAE